MNKNNNNKFNLMYLSSKHNPIALKKKIAKNANFKQKTTNLNLTYFPIIMSISALLYYI